MGQLMRSRGELYYLAKINAPCDGSIRCLGCDSEWQGHATAPSAEALCDVLNSMLWEHHVGVPHADDSSDG